MHSTNVQNKISKIFIMLQKNYMIVLSEEHELPYIQGVTGGTDQTSGECSLGQTIPI